jgi:hypothetical protein
MEVRRHRGMMGIEHITIKPVIIYSLYREIKIIFKTKNKMYI